MPIVDQDNNTYHFEVCTGKPPSDFDPTKGTVTRNGGTCLLTGEPISFDHIRAEGQANRMDSKLMAIVCEGIRGRAYISPTPEHEDLARQAQPQDYPETDLPQQALSFRVQLYGMDKHHKLFSPRQLFALTTFSDLVTEARDKVLEDDRAAGTLPDNVRPLDSGGTGSTAYSDAVTTYLAFGVSRAADAWSSLASWRIGVEATRGTFARQALPMVWDFAEANPFSTSCGNWSDASIAWIVKVLNSVSAKQSGKAKQLDATVAIDGIDEAILSTDPPYYDNIGYADLSDYFYIWLRRSLSQIYPQLFATLLTPKSQELIASPYRHNGSGDKAKRFFEHGLGEAFMRMRETQNAQYPLTLYYAFKQAESQGNTDDAISYIIASTGWETMLNGLISSGFSIHGTWPMRSERSARSVAIGTNALASSIVLVCRPRPEDAPMTTRRDFISALKYELPKALINLQHGNIAPVDLAQASIGPGMAVFTRYSKVMEADGSPMTVRAALVLINQTLDEVLAEQEGEFDADTRWAVAWFEQFGMEEGPFGVAETLSKAKDTAVSGMVEAGILYARGGKVRLLRREELLEDWNPATDSRFTIWEATQYLIRALDQKGEQGAAELLRKLGALGESARDLAYRLYNICERKKWAQEALAYNGLVIAWPEITRLAQGAPITAEAQTDMFESE
jgi:putative DNA methylase